MFPTSSTPSLFIFPSTFFSLHSSLLSLSEAQNKHLCPRTSLMSVEAQYPHLFSPQLYRNRESMNAIESPPCIYGNQMGFTGSDLLAQATTESGSGFVINHSNHNNNNNNNNNNNLISRKRSRDSLSFLGEDVSSQIYDHMLDVDRLMAQSMVNWRMELSQKRKRFSSQFIAAVNESVAKQLKCKDQEIEQLRKLNWAMEERIKSLGVENNAWKYLAQTHEAAAAALRANLEQVLADQAAVAEDAESCCGDNSSLPVEPHMRDWRMNCRSCGNGEPSVLLLPCRHLCLCSACGSMIDTCPICKCSKTGSVNVNLC